MGSISESIRSFLEPLSAAQKTIFGLLTLGLLLFLGTVFYMTLKPDYALLFGSLPGDSAREIVEELEEHGISYRVGDGGRSIYVPRNRVDELRMKLASVSLNHSDFRGYELFDENALGMTDFMQRVNKQRALEGELARSISSLEQIEHARVHLVLPERTPFQRTTVDASASIMVNLARGRTLNQAQVQGMTALVAGSVEGLETDAITILDQNGNRLTEEMHAGSALASGSMQMQLRQKSESYLTERGQSMLDRVLGPGNSVLRVAVEHDFEKLIRESDLIDPDSRVIISEERRSESNSDESFHLVPIDEFTPVQMRGETSLSSSRNNESTIQTRNYEVNTIRELFEKPQGDIGRITASVLLNHKQSTQRDDTGNTMVAHEPYTEEELDELRSVVASALGINGDRGDIITITQRQFFDPSADPHGHFVDQPLPWNQILRWVLIIAALAAFAALMYNISQRFREQQYPVLFRDLSEGQDIALTEDQYQESDEEGTMTEEEEDFYNRKLSSAARKQIEGKAQVVDEIRDFIEMHPQDAANVIRSLIAEDSA